MERALNVKRIIIVAGLLTTAIFLLLPAVTHAVLTEADKFCGTQFCDPGKCTVGKDPGCRLCISITCTDTTHGRKTTGNCTSSAPGECKGKSSQGLEGGSQGLGKEAFDLIKGLLDKLMQQAQQKKQKPEQPPPPPPSQQQQQCTSYYQVTTPTNDPCAVYKPGASGLLTQQLDQGGGGRSITDDLLGALAGEEDTQEESDDGATEEEAAESADEQQKEGTQVSTDGQQPSQVGSVPVRLPGGLVGRIEVGETGATAIAGERDEARGIEVAGFYGQTGTFTGEGGMVARLCVSRPWTGSLVSYLIPGSFFDSLCEWRGYKPPSSSPTQQTILRATPQAEKAPTAPKQPEPTQSSQKPAAHVWAVPARVLVGSRTSIFWNSKGVESCIVSSPDGSFYETGSSGGASTVPLSGPTIFSISCVVTDGEPATDYVTVEMAI